MTITDPPAKPTEKEQLASLREVNTSLREANRGMAERIKELEARPEPEAPPILLPVSLNSTVSRYDGLPAGEFVWHEAFSFRDDRGYDLSVLAERANGSIKRCFGQDPLGLEHQAHVYRDFGQGKQDVPGGRGFVPTNLPPFDPRFTLEVIVRIVPK